MKIIERYIGKSILVSTVFAVGILSLVLILGNIFKELLDLLINRDVPVQTVLAFILFVFPFSLTFTIPWGLLTGLLLVFGRISADNELIALRASGVSISLITIPVFCFALVLTAICCWINVDIAPSAEKKMLNSIFRIATHNPSSLFSANDVMDQFPGHRIYVGERQQNQLTNIILFEINGDHCTTRMVHARSGVLRPDPVNNCLLLKLRGAQFEEHDITDPLNIQKICQGISLVEGTFLIPLQKLYKKHDNTGRLSSSTMHELKQALSVASDPKRALRIKVEINRRFSTSLACVAFTLVAIPFGITTHRRETPIGFVFSMAIAFFYFLFILAARSLQENIYAHPDLLIWLPNVLFIGLGGYLFFRISTK
ncbi:putative permease YjgP/YjgQ family protein [Candidatus Xiphinematobacter sp. Idaho Grape]|uniref:LptF/LptG family permease n=1 Tax=Candidatus Xiphinematobacter sp. Idaho Grape TaxID=1704307 RepID=UPI000705F61A|nr:LptF/LptG family permease [Candidatus Xiphinematobacter sp. Idaho Grape]ALJ56708.1 putative permease YjgP/YjgQ family protein [Candidatus Xiphinematobacter sp. Idaho Grape]